MRWKAPYPLALFALSLPACASSTGEEVRAHRFPAACAALPRASSAERAELERALLHRTHVVLRARAVGRDELHRRLGIEVFKTDVVLFQYDVVDDGHPCCTVELTPRVVAAGSEWLPASRLGVWREAGITPPAEDASAHLLDMLAPHQDNEHLSAGSVLHRLALLVPPSAASSLSMKDAELAVTLRFSLAESDHDDTCALEIERRFPLLPGPSLAARLKLFLDARDGEIVFGEGRL